MWGIGPGNCVYIVLNLFPTHSECEFCYCCLRHHSDGLKQKATDCIPLMKASDQENLDVEKKKHSLHITYSNILYKHDISSKKRFIQGGLWQSS